LGSVDNKYFESEVLTFEDTTLIGCYLEYTKAELETNCNPTNL